MVTGLINVSWITGIKLNFGLLDISRFQKLCLFNGLNALLRKKSNTVMSLLTPYIGKCNIRVVARKSEKRPKFAAAFIHTSIKKIFSTTVFTTSALLKKGNMSTLMVRKLISLGLSEILWWHSPTFDSFLLGKRRILFMYKKKSIQAPFYYWYRG